MPEEQTIFALSSGAPPAAIAIMRISGPNAGTVLAGLAGALPKPRHAVLRQLKADGLLLDHALVLWFPGPLTATGEDLAELHLHGGRAVLRAMETVLNAIAGLRRAEPGEFTRRAFANGRLDLAQAEALGDLLFAETEIQRRSAMAGVSGQFSAHIEHFRQEVLRLSAAVEAALDFADEDDVDDGGLEHVRAGAMHLAHAVATMLASPGAEKLREGIRVVVAGPPNSGKSSLINALSGTDAAIVSDIAGTTRDRIEVPVALGGIPFVLTDTAGLRDDSADPIERIGIERARAAVDGADILLWLGREGTGPTHPALWEIDAQCDRADVARKSAPVLRLSAHSGQGMDALRTKLVRAAQSLLPQPGSFAVNQRQRRHLDELHMALTSVESSHDPLAIAEDLRTGRLALDAITGRSHTEDMLDTLFGQFCIGK